MNKPLISFHGSQEIKDAKIADIKRHIELDNLRKGAYWKNQKGCAVTCTMFTPEDFANDDVVEHDLHGRYETQLGIPRILARLEDRFFEGMPLAASREWPLKFIEAIPVGVNLENVWRKFMIWMLVDDAEGVIKFSKNEKTRIAIQNVADAFSRSLTTTVPREEWQRLRSAAADAAADAAAAAAYAAAAYAAAYAAYAADADAAAAAAAAYAAAAAAYAAADAADAAARSAHFFKMSEKLIELLKEAA